MEKNKHWDEYDANGITIYKRPLGGYIPNYCPFCGSEGLELSGSGFRCNGQCGESFWLD